MFSASTLSQFELTSENISQAENENTFWVKKWDWEYGLAHKFQRHCLEILNEHPKTRILIMCNHPKVFTNGRGLQKAKKGQSLNLVDFDPKIVPLLPFPFHQIERGGGLTFHHPGQFVFYPIVKLNPAKLSLSTMIDEVFEKSKDVLESWGLKGLSTENDLLGLWLGPKKLASMGIAIEKLTTFHGMALNIFKDVEMQMALSRLNPCGISGETYTSVEENISLPKDALDTFAEEFRRRIDHAWK